MSVEKARNAGYLCAACAEREGGVWPKEHCATFHNAECPLCGHNVALASWDDWDWPNTTFDSLAKQTREI